MLSVAAICSPVRCSLVDLVHAAIVAGMLQRMGILRTYQEDLF
ncbi:hypothetical protein [Kineosporia babensis]|nr:hypothetical protein [Kineosporia babensis]